MNNRNHRLIGIFAYIDDLERAIRSVREKGLKIDTVYSPFHSHEIIDAIGMKPSSVRYFALGGALIGILSGFGLASYTSVQWNLIVSGKPVVALIPYVIVGFEFCILFGIFGNLLGLVLNTRLPQWKTPPLYDTRFSGGRFGLVVKCPDARKRELAELLTGSGAEEVHETSA